MPAKLFIKVETYGDDDDPLTVKVIDWNNTEDNSWFISNLIWAMLNDKDIQIQPATRKEYKIAKY